MLTPKQVLFVAEYQIDTNATKAAVRAGYSPKTAKSQGQRLLTNVDVKAAIDKKLEKREQRLDITADRVLQELAKSGFANMLDYMTLTKDGEAFVDFSKLTRDQAAAIQEITVEEYVEGKGDDSRNVKRTKFKLMDKNGSLQMLGRHFKMFTDKVEHSGEIKTASDEELKRKLAELTASL